MIYPANIEANQPRRGQTEHLGINAKYTAASPKDERDFRDSNIQNRYRLRNIARELLPDFRVSTCGIDRIPKKEIRILKDNQTGKAHWSGLSCCGSVWVCPPCAAKVSVKRRAEIEEGLQNANDEGLKVLFVTLTSRHNRDMSLQYCLKRSNAAKSFMLNHRTWKKLRSRWGYIGMIVGTEITWGFTSGWHVHFHVALILSRNIDPKEAEDRIFELWSHALEHEDLDCDREHGVMVLAGFDKVASYMTKWGLTNELTSKDKIGRDGHYSPFQLLELYSQGEGWAGWLYQEYADATKGIVSLGWYPRPRKNKQDPEKSKPGLRKRLGVGAEATDQELAEEEQTGRHQTVLVTFTSEQYKNLLYSGRRGVLGEALVVAERGRDVLIYWLKACFDIDIPP